MTAPSDGTAVELLVRLKIPDVTALTASNALRRRMGYADLLAGLQRADYYRLTVAPPTAEEAHALVRELAERTNVFVNPNKDVFEVRMPRAAGKKKAPRTADGFAVEVLVTDPADGSAEGALAALHERLGYRGRVLGLLRGTLWTLTLRTSTAEEALRVARDIAVTERIDRGLLMNPHFQECSIAVAS